MARGISIDAKYHGEEPVITNKSSDIEVIRAYNWFNYFHSADDAKKFVIDYLKAKKIDRETIKKVNDIEPQKLLNIGWNCRILSKGGSLPKHIHKRVSSKLNDIIDLVPDKKQVTEEKTVSIQERTAQKVSVLISELEGQIDLFCQKYKSDFNAINWFKAKALKPQVAKKIVDYYTPLHEELSLAYKGTDADVKDAYSHIKKAQLKRYVAFVEAIISAGSVQTPVVKKPRKVQPKKAKPASVQVSKLNYKKEDAEYNIKSVKASDIVGCSQLWVFNTKTRNLTVLCATDKSGLSVTGTTVSGFDEKTSQTKKLRKPADVIQSVLTLGKIPLNKLMDDIKTKPTKVSGRINIDTVLLRIIK